MQSFERWVLAFSIHAGYASKHSFNRHHTFMQHTHQILGSRSVEMIWNKCYKEHGWYLHTCKQTRYSHPCNQAQTSMQTSMPASIQAQTSMQPGANFHANIHASKHPCKSSHIRVTHPTNTWQPWRKIDIKQMKLGEFNVRHLHDMVSMRSLHRALNVGHLHAVVIMDHWHGIVSMEHLIGNLHAVVRMGHRTWGTYTG